MALRRTPEGWIADGRRFDPAMPLAATRRLITIAGRSGIYRNAGGNERAGIETENAELLRAGMKHRKLRS